MHSKNKKKKVIQTRTKKKLYLKMCSLLDLDEYAVEQILSYLTEIDLVRVSMTCTLLETLVNQYMKPIIGRKLMVCAKKK